MIKIFSFLFFTLISITLYAQNTLKIIYNFSDTFQSRVFNAQLYLIDNKNRSEFNVQQKTALIKNDKVRTEATNQRNNEGFFYDKISDKGYYFTTIFGKETFVEEDSLSKLIKWKIFDTVVKKLLNFNCKYATCYHRGRIYTAYYTEELPFITGPYKFTGLPGTILELSAANKRFNYTAININTYSDTSLKINPYIPFFEKMISFNDYRILFNKKMNEIIANDRAKNIGTDYETDITDNSMEK